jgi:predicted Zn-dependent peptidase
MRNLVLSGLALLALGSSYSQKKIEFVEYDLPNGIHVILHEEHSTPIVAVSVLYHVGSKNENPDRTGFAHFFEHLLFEGSENIGRGKYSDVFKAMKLSTDEVACLKILIEIVKNKYTCQIYQCVQVAFVL